MGLFDFFRKHKMPSTTPAKGEESTNSFKGDLAFVANPKGNPPSTNPNDTAPANIDTDSKDSTIFMSFAPMEKNRWICPECGTINNRNLDGCIVCGLKKQGENYVL